MTAESVIRPRVGRVRDQPLWVSCPGENAYEANGPANLAFARKVA